MNYAPSAIRPNYTPTYLTYRPMDIWYGQNALNAQARATDRAIANSSSPSRMAGLLANGYNSQIVSGNLFRNALEYNDARRDKVAAHNSAENKTLAQLDMQAQMANQNTAMQSAAQNARYKALGYQMMDELDANRSQSISANLGNVLNSLGAIGEEEFDTDRLGWLERAGVLKSNVYSANGGKISRKKGKKGLTY